MTHSRRKHSYGIELYYILSIVALIVGGIFAVWGPGGYIDMRRAQDDLARRKTEVDLLRNANREQAIRIEQLNSDPAALEEYARRSGYAREGEIIQQLPRTRSDRQDGVASPASKRPAGP